MNRDEDALPIITLLSDFGLTEPFVGVMKGVALSHCPRATLVDLTHGIAPQAVDEGRFWLERAWPWFPAGSVHLAVVDPGVGTARRGVVVTVAGHFFVGPDNGLFHGIANAVGAVSAARAIDATALGLGPLSSTFHGRDVFAPVAGRLAARTLNFADVGPLCELLPGGAAPVEQHGDELHGVVITLDHFGNAITNIGSTLLTELGGLAALSVEAAGQRFECVSAYGAASPGAGVAILNSGDVLELAVRDGSAAELFGVRRGTRVIVRKSASAAS